GGGARGTVAVGGPMVPRAAFPPGAERARLPTLKLLADGFTDTGYTCRSDSMIVTGPPPGLMSVGGYRFLPRDLENVVNCFNGGATLTAPPHALARHRLPRAPRAPPHVAPPPGPLPPARPSAPPPLPRAPPPRPPGRPGPPAANPAPPPPAVNGDRLG